MPSQKVSVRLKQSSEATDLTRLKKLLTKLGFELTNSQRGNKILDVKGNAKNEAELRTGASQFGYSVERVSAC